MLDSGEVLLQVLYTSYASFGFHCIFFYTPGDSKKTPNPKLVLHCVLSTFFKTLNVLYQTCYIHQKHQIYMLWFAQAAVKEFGKRLQDKFAGNKCCLLDCLHCAISTVSPELES